MDSFVFCSTICIIYTHACMLIIVIIIRDTIMINYRIIIHGSPTSCEINLMFNN